MNCKVKIIRIFLVIMMRIFNRLKLMWKKVCNKSKILNLNKILVIGCFNILVFFFFDLKLFYCLILDE